MNRLRLALRSLFKTPFVSLVAIASLALGIGANSAIFSLFDQVLLRALPVVEPERLVNLIAPGPKHGHTSSGIEGGTDDVFSYPMFRDLQAVSSPLEGVAGHRSFEASLSFEGRTESVPGLLVSGSYFDVLGLRPALGRLLGPGDDAAPGGQPLVVLSHDYWRSRFGSSPDVVGARMVVNGALLSVAGVAPAGFGGTSLGVRPRIFVPITMRGALLPGDPGFENRLSYWVYVFGRLSPEATPEQAGAALGPAYAAILSDVEAPLQEGLSDEALARFRAKRLEVVPGSRGQSDLQRAARAPLALLFGVTGFVLLIACANVANLLLARGAARSAEMALRLSIGASRRQLVGQLLVESTLLAALGGLAGLLVARLTLRGLHTLLSPVAAESLAASLDLRVAAFAALVALGTGLGFGLFPALESTRTDLVSVLRGDAGQAGGGGAAARFRDGLAVAQMALSLTLLAAAGLFTKSLDNLSRVDLGLDTGRLVVFEVSPERSGYDQGQTLAFYDRLEDELRAIPGVESVAASRVPLIAGSSWGTNVRVQGFEAAPGTDTHSSFNTVGPGYFRTLGIPLLAGREFERSDADGAAEVAIVNRTFARRFGLGDDAVGRRMGVGGDDELELEIVGLVPDSHYSEVKDAPPPQFFVPYRQSSDPVGTMHFYLRSRAAPESVVRAVPAAVGRLDPDLPVDDLRTMRDQVELNVSGERLISVLSVAFASIATLLAAVGLYGVLAYTVGQRTRELGLRMALGADAARLRRMVLAQVGRMALAGGALGLAATIGLGRAARSMLFQLEGHDPLVLGAAAIALGSVALLAGWLPAWRASRVDPMTALRQS